MPNFKPIEKKWIFRKKSFNASQIKKSGSAITSAIYQLMPNFRAIGQSVWEKNANTQTETHTETQTDRLEFYKDRYLFYHIFPINTVRIEFFLN